MTLVGNITVGDLHSTLGDILVNRSVVSSTVSDQSLFHRDKLDEDGLWVGSWQTVLSVNNASIPVQYGVWALRNCATCCVVCHTGCIYGGNC